MPNLFSVPFRAASIMGMRHRTCGLAACLLSSMALLSGCAKQPPGQSSNIPLSGKRLVVTMHFQEPVNPNNHYFFLINYDTSQGGAIGAGNPNAPGPVAVLGPSNANQGYGNGFATGSSGNVTTGFTDFVRFEGNSYRLFHVKGSATNPNLNNFADEGQPIAFTLPNSADPHFLRFEIDLAQLVVQSSGASLDDPTKTVNLAKNIRWLQVNFVATDVIPVNQTTAVIKQVDSLGNTQTQLGASSFLILDMSQTQSYSNQDFVGRDVFEPAGDVYGAANPDLSLDLIDYNIKVVQQ